MPEAERKLARSMLRSYTLRLLKEQGGYCPLCRGRIDPREKNAMVLDHDHQSGRIRGVLCRGCNGAEGKVANAVSRWGKTGEDYTEIIAWLERMLEYLKRPSKPLLYPMHKSKEERRAERLAKQRLAQAKRRAKQRLQEAAGSSLIEGVSND